MRDHTKLRAFELADQFALLVYKHTATFPREEQFGLTSQVRRAAVSVPSNIVEGCARPTQADYVNFLDIAYGSASEAKYQLSLAFRLGFLNAESNNVLASCADELTRLLLAQPNCQRSRAPRPTSTSVPGIELTQPLYESGVIPLDHQCLFRLEAVGLRL